MTKEPEKLAMDAGRSPGCTLTNHLEDDFTCFLLRFASDLLLAGHWKWLAIQRKPISMPGDDRVRADHEKRLLPA